MSEDAHDSNNTRLIKIVLRCPFCDSLAISLRESSVFYYRCDACFAKGPYGKTQQQGLSLWNKRRYNPGTTAEGEANDGKTLIITAKLVPPTPSPEGQTFEEWWAKFNAEVSPTYRFYKSDFQEAWNASRAGVEGL
jgi:hypothetical protein